MRLDGHRFRVDCRRLGAPWHGHRAGNTVVAGGNVSTDKGYVLWISICFGYSDLEHFHLLPKYSSAKIVSLVWGVDWDGSFKVRGRTF